MSHSHEQLNFDHSATDIDVDTCKTYAYNICGNVNSDSVYPDDIRDPKNFNMEIRGSSSKILTKTKSPTVVISISNQAFGNNYQNFQSKNICSAIVSANEEASKSLS